MKTERRPSIQVTFAAITVSLWVFVAASFMQVTASHADSDTVVPPEVTYEFIDSEKGRELKFDYALQGKQDTVAIWCHLHVDRHVVSISAHNAGTKSVYCAPICYYRVFDKSFGGYTTAEFECKGNVKAQPKYQFCKDYRANVLHVNFLGGKANCAQ